MKRPERPGFWQDAAIGAILAIACFFLFLATRPAQAEEPKGDGATLRVLDCGAVTCIVVSTDLRALLASNDANYDRAVKAEAELAKLRKSKGCAKLEVTEPPRNFVPKKERES